MIQYLKNFDTYISSYNIGIVFLLAAYINLEEYRKHENQIKTSYTSCLEFETNPKFGNLFKII